MDIVWRGFPLHPDTPPEGQSLDLIFANYPYPKEDMIEHLKRNARALGLPFGPRSMTYNTRLAQELGLWAQDEGCGDLYHHAAFRAYFVDGENLAQRDVLLRLAADAGLDRDRAAHIIDERTYAEAVDRDWARVEALAITAAPTFVIGNDKLVGAQEYRSLAAFVAEHGAGKVQR